MRGLNLGISEAVFRRCSSKQVFLNILQIHREAPVLESLFNKVTGLRPVTCNFSKMRLQHRRFPAKFVKLLRTPSFTGHLWWLFFGFQKTVTRPFTYQKTDAKRNPWVAIYEQWFIQYQYMKLLTLQLCYQAFWHIAEGN